MYTTNLHKDKTCTCVELYGIIKRQLGIYKKAYIIKSDIIMVIDYFEKGYNVEVNVNINSRIKMDLVVMFYTTNLENLS